MLTVDYDRLGLSRGDRLLDLGCGFGRHAFEGVLRGAQVVALDAGRDEVRAVRSTFGAMIDSGELDRNTAHAGAVQGNALALPFGDGVFDFVIASEVLEHIPNDISAMRELARVLKPGGTMAVTVPRCGPEMVNWLLSNEYHEVEGGHIRIYRRSTLRKRLGLNGLSYKQSHHAHGLHSAYWWLKCAVGTKNETNPFVSAYHKLLVWDIQKGPLITRSADRVLSPLMGKSFVIYVEKSKSEGTQRADSDAVDRKKKEEVAA